MDQQQAYRNLRKKLADRHWRLNNLYWIKDKSGKKIRFRMNWAQATFYGALWYFNVVLKARQLGFTTFILIYFLDACLFNSNHAAGVIAHTLDDAKKIFRDKVKFAYDNLPDWLKAEITATTDSARTLEFSNGSSIFVGTSLRGGTYQKLLVSEFGKIAAKSPEKAKEIKTGAFNTIEVGQQIFVESTAEGSEGEFFDICELAKKLMQEGRPLTVLDPKFHFFPWWQNPEYRLSNEDTQATVITADDEKYFTKVEGETGTKLMPDQRAWYVKKKATQGAEMRREFPSTSEEAFEASVDGAYFATEMALVRAQNRICTVPWESVLPVHTFWDLGMNDSMAIIFFQQYGKEYRAIDYYENSGEGLQHYAQVLLDRPYTYGKHFLPHDGEVRDLSANRKTRRQVLESLGIKPIVIVPRTQDINDDIQKCRNILPKFWFDEVKCAPLVRHLDNFRKEWDDQRGVWKSYPRHDQASHGVSAFRTLACGYKEPPAAGGRPATAHTHYDELSA